MSPRGRTEITGILTAALLALLSARLTVADTGELRTPVELQTFKTHSRLSIRLDEGIATEYRADRDGFELLLKGVALLDLGAPLGAEAQWVRERLQVSDARLASLEATETPRGVRVRGRWKFPGGDLAPAEPAMEHFEYRQGRPGRYVLDFWPKGGPTVAEARARRTVGERNAKLERSAEAARRAQDRKLAAERAREERADLGRYCRQPLSEQNSVILPFLPAREKAAYDRYFPTSTPDAAYEYHRPDPTPATEDGKTSDAQYARLAIDLYRKGKPALVIRTLDFFEKEHPASPYRHELRFLRANALIRLEQPEAAERILLALVTDGREHSVALHAAMYLAGKQVTAGQHLAALESFLWLQKHHGSHRLAWLFHLGAAESLAALKQTERATQEYEWVADNAPTPALRAQGALRIGDLYLDRRQYDQAVAAYFRGISRFPAESETFPTVHLNRAEALFWLGETDAAARAFREFLGRHRVHPQGWRATYRLGEIVQRTATEETAEARRWYVETINGFPYSPGATLARLRLLVCGDRGGFTVESAEKFFREEAAKFAGRGEVATERYRDLLAWSQVRAYHALGETMRALDAALEELRLRPDTLRYAEIADAFHTSLRTAVLARLREGKGFEALKLFEDRQERLPLKAREKAGAERDYLLALAREASELGLPLVADKVRRLGEAGAVESGRGPAEATPSENAAERAFTQAKSLWIAKGAAEAERVRALLAEVTDDSEFAYGRELIRGLIEEREGRMAAALAHAAKAQLLLPAAKAKSSDEAVVLQHWISRLQRRAGEDRAAIESIRAVLRAGAPAGTRGEGLARALGLPPVADSASLGLEEGELLGKIGEWGDAATAYGRAFEAGAANRALYEQSRAASRAGDEAGARKLLERLAASETEDFWNRLAKEALANRETAGKFN